MSTCGLLALAPKTIMSHPYPNRDFVAGPNDVLVATAGHANAGQRCSPKEADWLVSHRATSELNVCSIIARAFAIVNRIVEIEAKRGHRKVCYGPLVAQLRALILGRKLV